MRNDVPIIREWRSAIWYSSNVPFVITHKTHRIWFIFGVMTQMCTCMYTELSLWVVPPRHMVKADCILVTGHWSRRRSCQLILIFYCDEDLYSVRERPSSKSSLDARKSIYSIRIYIRSRDWSKKGTQAVNAGSEFAGRWLRIWTSLRPTIDDKKTRCPHR